MQEGQDQGRIDNDPMPEKPEWEPVPMPPQDGTVEPIPPLEEPPNVNADVKAALEALAAGTPLQGDEDDE